MDTTKLSHHERTLRSNIRGFLLTATLEELKKELTISKDRGDTFRAECVQELIDEETK